MIELKLTEKEHETLMQALEVATTHVEPLTALSKYFNELALKCQVAAIPKLYPDIYYDFCAGECKINLDAPRKIALTLLDDILGRRGYRQEFDGMDECIQNEIADEWVLLIDANINSNSTAMMIAKAITLDVRSRGGWDDVYHTIDEDIREEMLETWLKKMQEFLPVDA